jgi:hypothetical protein
MPIPVYPARSSMIATAFMAVAAAWMLIPG